MAFKIRNVRVEDCNGHGVVIEGDGIIDLTRVQINNVGMDGLNATGAINTTIDDLSISNVGGNGMSIKSAPNFKSEAEVLEYFGMNDVDFDRTEFINSLRELKTYLDNNTRPEVYTSLPSFKVFKQGAMDTTTIVANLVTISPLIPAILKLFGM